MVKLQEILNYLNELSPFELQEEWDNSGLQLGHPEREIEKITVAFDIDAEMIKDAENGTLFIVHHPVIFGRLSELDFSRYPSDLLELMILKKHSLISLHTNFDRTHLNRYVFTRILGLEVEQEEPFICECSADWTLEDLKKRLSMAFGLEYFRMVAPRKRIKSLALCTGSGASMMDHVRSDCFITGDIKYHDAVKAASQGLMMVDIGHYESERFFAELMASELKNLPVSVIITPSKNPFITEWSG